MQRKGRQETRQDDRPARPQGSPAPHHPLDGPELNGASITPSDKPQTSTDTSEGVSMRRVMAEIRMTSGISWDELGEIFGIPVQKVLLWASGEHPDPANQELVMQVLEVARHATRGTAAGTRTALHDASKGTSPFDLIMQRRFDDAREALGPIRTDVYRPTFDALDETEDVLPKPPPPYILIDALEDRVHKDLGRTRVVPSFRKKRRDGS